MSSPYKVQIPCVTWLLSRRVPCHFRFNNVFMTCWNTLIVLKMTLLNMIGFCPAWQKQITAAWLGLTPSQYSSGGKSKPGRITKAGDSYLRTLLVQGARSVLIGAEKRTDSFSRWVCSLVERRGYWRAIVAIAAKNARLCWASLHYGDNFRLYSAS